MSNKNSVIVKRHDGLCAIRCEFGMLGWSEEEYADKFTDEQSALLEFPTLCLFEVAYIDINKKRN